MTEKPAVAPEPAFDAVAALLALDGLTEGANETEFIASAYFDGNLSATTLAAAVEVASSGPRNCKLLISYLDGALRQSEPESDACLHAAVLSVPMAEALHSGWYTMRGAAVRDIQRAARVTGLSGHKGAPDEGHVSLLKAHLFAGRVGIYPEAYPSKRDYDRAMELLRQSIDEVEACLPPIAASILWRAKDSADGGQIVDTDDLPRVNLGLTWADVRKDLDAVQSSGLDPQEVKEFMDARYDYDLNRVIALMLQSSAPLRDGAL